MKTKEIDIWRDMRALGLSSDDCSKVREYIEEYGKLMYNQAIEDACNNATTIYDTGVINEVLLKSGYNLQYKDNDLIYKPSILKLKKQ